MQIHGFNKTTLLDFPGRVAATLFTGSCNFRCPFCHNGDLVLQPDAVPLISEEEVLETLQKRKGILSGVCITGGEPTLQKDLPEFLQKIKELGLLVKLDTNGYLPQAVKSLAEKGLLDYIAMDIKSSREHYRQAAGVSHLELQRICETVDFISSCGLPYEFRTTVVRELHTKEDMEGIGQWLQGCRSYFLQSYRESGAVLQKGFSSCSRRELEEFLSIIQAYIPNASLRGVD